MPRDFQESEPAWHVATTTSGAGRLVIRQLHLRLIGEPEGGWLSNHLIHDGLEIYLPLEEVRTAGRHGRVHYHRQSLYGPYLFARMDESDPERYGRAWSTLTDQRGVRGFVAAIGGGIAKVDHGQIARLRALENLRGVIPRASAKALFAPGEEVAAISGPFEGHRVVIERADTMVKERIDWRGAVIKEKVATQHVRVSIFGRDTPAEIEERDLERVS